MSREHAKNVKRWRDGTMALRWCTAGMLETDHQFRRVNGCACRWAGTILAARGTGMAEGQGSA